MTPRLPLQKLVGYVRARTVHPTLYQNILVQVRKTSVVYDPYTRESHGFGFVTVESAEEAEAAVTALNAIELMGKAITVEKVRPWS